MAIPLLVRKNFADLVEEKVSLLSLAADPVKFVKPLWFIQDYYEEEHSNHLPYDVRRLPLPHRFFPFPTPSGSSEQSKRYTIYILKYLEILFSFYGPGMGETRFRLYQGSKCATDTMVSMLSDAGIKYNKEKGRTDEMAKEEGQT
ncbi:hypothetical protein BDF20DRAFT_351508 [Mycotypha africana]|uniref:uncharacterized protein n=1 Tax=Mycotypha africana TaxID=64632 RepID=UPI0023009BDA|nr:uncharacterized protein BDF20DRAFT_351508 [Mycotypha africana]KAI8966964.1 hypothetical protein BDF20DRAFT_351508 [Mycotypha africana]